MLVTLNVPDQSTEIGAAAGPARRQARGAWIAAASALLFTGVVAACWIALSPRPRFDEADFLELAVSRKYDDAEEKIRAHIAASPGDGRAHFLFAQLMLERPDHVDPGMQADDASEALEHLDAIADKPSTGERDTPAIRLFYRGKAAHMLLRWDDAEAAWLAALDADPLVPEAGFALLDVYQIQGRRRDARELALRLFESEPDPRDRAILMLALLFPDTVNRPAKSLLTTLEPVTKAAPEGLRGQIALGQTMILATLADEGLGVLSRAYERFSESPDSEDARIALRGLLAGLDLANRPEELCAVLDKQSDATKGLPALARYRGICARHRGDWAAAVEAFTAARADDPGDFELTVRLAHAARMNGDVALADELDALVFKQREALKEFLPLDDELRALSNLGVEPHPEPCERLATVLDTLGRTGEARAWREIGKGAAAVERTQ